MRLNWRKSINLIPGLLRINLSRSGISETWHLGKLASWNTRTRRRRINLPGPIWLEDTTDNPLDAPRPRRRRRTR